MSGTDDGTLWCMGCGYGPLDRDRLPRETRSQPITNPLGPVGAYEWEAVKCPRCPVATRVTNAVWVPRPGPEVIPARGSP